MIQIAICEDRFMDQLVLRHILEKQVKDRHMECMVDVFPNGPAFLEHYKSGKYDVVFLDIMMKKMNGIEVGQAIREIDLTTEIVYVTSSTEHALESYGVFAMGYLLKPFDVEKIDVFLNYYFNKHPDPKTKLIKLRMKGVEHIVYFSDIIYLESSDKIVSFHTSNQGIISLYHQLNLLEPLLNDERFMRCHQSYIVNMDYVTDHEKGDLILEDGRFIPLRKKQKKALVTRFCEYRELKL